MKENAIEIEVERYTKGNCFFYDKLLLIANDKRLDLSLFFTKYKGIEGFSHSRKKNQFNKILIDQEKCTDFDTYGFEVGKLDTVFCSYSSIFHEIVFSKINIFLYFFENLNENYLFPNYEIAKKYLNYHQETRMKGVDLESEDCLCIYRIFSSTDKK